MGLAADSKKAYLIAPQIEAQHMQDATGEYYRLTPKGYKAIMDAFADYANKIQGNLTLSDLTSLAVDELRSNVVISNTVITNNLYSVYGDIAELTVDRVVTADKIKRYQDSDTSDINYIKIQDQSMQFITGSTTGATTQHTDRDGNLLYWTDSTQNAMGTTSTAYPVTVYSYTELVKAKYGFEYDTDTETYVPKIVLGVGTGTGDNGKAFISKAVDGLYLDYYNTAGALRRIKLGNDGIVLSPYALESIDFYSNGFSAAYSGDEIAYTWTKNGDGLITQLTSSDGDTIPVTWNTGNM